MIKCDTCINSRSVCSENGYHSVCTLSTKKERYCIENGFCEHKKITIGDALEGIAKGNVSFEEGVDKACHLFALGILEQVEETNADEKDENN